MRPTRVAVAAGLVGGASIIGASPAWAHGVGGRSDLPLPLATFAWGAAIALIVSFAAFGVLWKTPRLERAAAGRALPAGVDRVLSALAVPGRVLFGVLLVVVVSAALVGSEFPAANIAPIAIYVTFWVGMQAVQALVGDVWRAVNPFDTIAIGVDAVRRRLRAAGTGGDGVDARAPAADATHWPALVGLGGFLWLELAYHSSSSPRVLGWMSVAYLAFVVAGVARQGRSFIATGEGFTVLFTLLAAMAPLHRDDEGRLRARLPFTGLADLEIRRGTMAVILVVLGSTTFDGVTRTDFWGDIVENKTGWELTIYNTLGVLWTVALVAMVYLLATRVMSRITGDHPDDVADAFVPSLVPILFAYAVAHYFSLLVLEGQGFWYLLSDPYGEGWDLFGTADGTIDFLLVSTGTIAWVQAGAVVLGHVAAVMVAHDRALADYGDADHGEKVAVRSQYPMLVAMVAYTVAALLLLLGA